MGETDTGRLPAELSSFVGRRQELTEIRRRLTSGRMVTLIGTGGVGKTRLALRSARDVRRAFPDGVWLVELAGLDEPALLAQTVAAVLGLRDASDDPTTRLADYLEDKRLLLVLDNCEHLVGACAVLAGKLLAAAGGVRILATSRHSLGVESEQLLTVTPLAVPDAAGPEADPVLSPAVTLFAERGAAVTPGFTVDARNRAAVIGICRRLDGLPLALELAAARLRSLSVDQLLERLDDRFRLLTTGGHTAPARQRTLTATFDWSYGLCSPAEQTLWARLSVFAGGFDLEAAEEVVADEEIPRENVLDLVAALVDKSILVREGDSYGRAARYRMLETTRQYGQSLLAAAGEREAIRARHLQHYHRIALRYVDEHFGPAQVDWIQRLILRHANIRQALEHGLAEPDQVRTAMRTAAALWDFWFAGGFLREGYQWLCRALELDREPTRVRAAALSAGAFLGTQLGEAETATRLLAEARDLAERLADPAIHAQLAGTAGLAALYAGDVEKARDLLTDAMAQSRAVGDLLGLANAMILLAGATFFLGDPAGAEVAADCLRLCEEHGATWTKCYALWGVAIHQWRTGDHRAAATTIQEAVRLQRSVHDWTGLAYYLEVLAWCAGSAGEPERTARLLGGAMAVWQLSGARAFDAPPYHAVDEQAAAQARRTLTPGEYATAFEQGSEFTLDQLIGYALGEKAEPVRSDRAPGAVEAVLTPREWEVAKLVGEGLTNKQIAARLVVSQRTAETHVEHALTKLGFTSRAQIAAWIAQIRAEQ